MMDFLLLEGWDECEAEHHVNIAFEIENESQQGKLLHIEAFVAFMAPYIKRKPNEKDVIDIVSKYSSREHPITKGKVLTPDDALPMFNAIFNKSLDMQQNLKICMNVDTNFDGFISVDELMDYFEALVVFDDNFDFAKLHRKLRSSEINLNIEEEEDEGNLQADEELLQSLDSLDKSMQEFLPQQMIKTQNERTKIQKKKWIKNYKNLRKNRPKTESQKKNHSFLQGLQVQKGSKKFVRRRHTAKYIALYGKSV